MPKTRRLTDTTVQFIERSLPRRSISMPRNRYTKEVHSEERRIIELQEVQLEKLARALQRAAKSGETPLFPVVNSKKIQRSERRRQARKHKPARYRNAGTQSF
jgi:hypothetical protein